MMNPVRMQLQRRKGFNLQIASFALNGLPVVNCARPSKWGNPFTISEYGSRVAILNFKARINGLLLIKALDLSPLRGKNLACWCQIGTECHADVLLELANR